MPPHYHTENLLPLDEYMKKKKKEIRETPTVPYMMEQKKDW